MRLTVVRLGTRAEETSATLEPLAIEDFCTQVSPRLIGSLTLHCGDRLVAEELVQEALARAWERWDAVSQMANPAGWVYRTAFNLAMSRRRRVQAEDRAQRRASRPIVAPNDVADRLTLLGALGELPPRQRAAVVLRFYGQLSIAETAEAMSCAPGTVKSLTNQGVARLRSLLEETMDAVEADDD